MMSATDNVVPFLAAPRTLLSRGALCFSSAPGLSPEAIQGLEASFPGTLTHEMRSLLQAACGLTSLEFGSVDFTGRWYPHETLNVLRPCITLAIDDDDRRWIAETSREAGLPGPVWCVFPEPAVAMYVADDLAEFLSKVGEAMHRGRVSKWLSDLRRDARTIWACRQALAREAYRDFQRDRPLRGWLAELPFDARVYDLRTPCALRGWPYGLAGPGGRLYRCERLAIFAVCRSYSPSRWAQHMTQIAATHETPTPAIARSLAA